MVFSDTSNKNGIIQRCEDWTNLGDGTISGDGTLLKQFTAKINDAFDELMPLLLSYTDKGRWDDNNNTDYPIATFNLVSGQNDYSIKTDGSSLDILRIFDVQILTSATGTIYTTLHKITLHDENALDAMSPSTTTTGVPDSWLERDNVVFLSPKPNYSATSGVKIFYERIESYFASTDTTKAPGIPRIFHPILPLIASRDWLAINKPDNVVTIQTINGKIADMKKHLEDSVSMRNPSQGGFRVSTNPSNGRIYTDNNR